MSVLQAIEAELEKSRAALLRTAEQVPDAQFHVRPSEEAWSVSEILHHLVLVENRIVDRVGPAIAGARAQGTGPEPADSSVHLRSLDHFQIERVTRPIQSRTIPESGHERAELLAGLGESRKRLLSIMKTAEGIDLSGLTAPHPAFGELNLYQWLIFIGRHEERHRTQIERVTATVRTR